jgi:hypothetical protein
MMVAATTTGTYVTAAANALASRACGVLEQTGITDTPPNPATPVAYTRANVPLIVAHYKTTV